jgi:hypothetical protein
MESFLQPFFTLFILSLASEKVTNFIKLQFASLFCKTNDTAGEKKREKQIQYISITTGLVIAIAAKANIFLMFQPDFQLFWTDVDAKGESPASNIIGSVLSGLFLSLGSKFFHDLIDLVLEMKNLKRTLAEGQQKNLDTLKEQERNSLLKKSKEIEVVCQPIIEKIENVKGVSHVALEFGERPLLHVVVAKDFDIKKNVFPTAIPYLLSTGDNGMVTIRIVKDQPATQSSIAPGAGLMNSSPYQGNTGSVGGVLYDKNSNVQVLFTCYHVIKSPGHNWQNFTPIGSERVEDSTHRFVGTIKTAIRDDKIDGALIQRDGDLDFDGSIAGIGLILIGRQMNLSDKTYATKVRMYGNSSQLSVGYVVDIERQASITYVDGLSHPLSDLIIVKGYQQQTFSKGGDSGSFVVDEYNYLVGVLVGGNNDLSFIIPIDNINNKLNTKIV